MNTLKNSNHLKLAHAYWKEILAPGDIVIDATCGNGHDTLFLAETVKLGSLYAFDVQIEAIEATKKLLGPHKVEFIHGSHTNFPDCIEKGSVKLIVYNLGYLPGGDKSKTTMTESTLKSLEAALELLKQGGMISITCYPGHLEGKKEEDALLTFASELNPRIWTSTHHRWINRQSAPSLLLINRDASQGREQQYNT